jgi:ubiquinone/menaquinone biosynthesis C-methylase UbiE
MKDGGRNGFAKQYHAIVGKEGDMDMKNTLNPAIFRILGNVKGKKILDLGCGNGYFSFMLEKKWAKVTGVDISSNLIAFAKETAKKLKSKSEFLVADAANLKVLKDKKFDIIVSNMAFMDIKDIKKTIKECSKHLRKTWLLLFSIANPIYGVSERVFDEKQKKYYLKLEKYGNIHSIQQKNFGTTHHHRPISFYITTLVENGFNITAYQEISTPYHQNKIMKDKALISYKKEIPSFLIIGARKK